MVELFDDGVVIIRLDENGDPDFLIAADVKARVFVIDERAPNDRVYELVNRASAKEIDDAFGEGPVIIGSANDDRHAACAARVIAAIEGKPRLQVYDFPKND